MKPKLLYNITEMSWRYDLEPTDCCLTWFLGRDGGGELPVSRHHFCSLLIAILWLPAQNTLRGAWFPKQGLGVPWWNTSLAARLEAATQNRVWGAPGMVTGC